MVPLRMGVPIQRVGGAALTRFIGRTAVLDALGCAIAAGDRMIVLVGPPGSGKTRLAVRFAELEAAAGRWSGGIFALDLTHAADSADLLETLARAFGPRRVQAERVPELLAACGTALLILDNFEQVGPDVRGEVAGWCARAPELRVVITSRARTQIEGEVVIDVGPLGIEEAVELFEDRAAAARGRLAERALDRGEVARVAEALDCLPLAIELAAARARVLSLPEIRTRLDRSRFELLARRPQRDDDPHARLEAAIETSWRSLEDDERTALAACSVFAGSFSLEAAERVLPASGATVLEQLESLTDSIAPRDGTGSGRRNPLPDAREHPGVRGRAAARVGAGARARRPSSTRVSRRGPAGAEHVRPHR